MNGPAPLAADTRRADRADHARDENSPQPDRCRSHHVSYYTIAELPAGCRERWSHIQWANPATASPQFRPEWAEILAACGRPVEVAVIEQAGVPTAFLAYERIKPNAAAPIGGILSDMHGIVSPEGFEVDMRRLLDGCNLASWTFDHVPTDQACFSRYIWETDPAPVMDIGMGFDHYRRDIESRHRGLWSQAQRKRRKLVRNVGPVRLETDERSEAALDALLDWKRRQLDERGFYNPYTDEKICEVLRRVQAARETNFSGRMVALWAGSRLVAACLCQKSADRLNAWIPAYDPDYSEYSPGMLLHLETAAAATDEGVRLIELGRGMNRLKSSLASWNQPLAIGCVETRLLHEMFHKAIYRIRSRVREIDFATRSIRYCRRLVGSLRRPQRSSDIREEVSQ